MSTATATKMEECDEKQKKKNAREKICSLLQLRLIELRRHLYTHICDYNHHRGDFFKYVSVSTHMNQQFYLVALA